MANRCDKGKSCGASCVQKSKSCAVILSPQISENLSKAASKIGVVALFEEVKQNGVKGYRAKFDQIRKDLHKELGHKLTKPEDVKKLKERLEKEGLLPSTAKQESTNEEWNGLPSREFDKKLEKEELSRVGNPSFTNWLPPGKSNPEVVGLGYHAEVSITPDGDKPLYIKRGILTDNEASILQKVGSKDLGPTLIAADLNGRVKTEDSNGPDLEMMSIEHLGPRHGRLAMTKVFGKQLDSLTERAEDKVYGIPAADIYWKALAQLHRMGIAHNDAHPGNLFVGDKSGKGRWIDFGMSQESPKAALAEALGAFVEPAALGGRNYRRLIPDEALGHISEGNWQTREWAVTGTSRVDQVASKVAAKSLEEDLPLLGRIRRNKIRVEKLLQNKYGLDRDEIAALYAHGIRSPLETYEQGPWSKLKESDAQELIQALYKGVPLY
jgi:hypothetical protein